MIIYLSFIAPSHLSQFNLLYFYICRPEADVVKTITRDMICEIIGKDCVEDGLVDKKSRLKKLKELIWKSEDVSMDGIRRKSRDVLMVGIFGSAGIGKTTIARALYDEISCQFDGEQILY